jgi:DNA-binding MarR family transcriptional regulator
MELSEATSAMRTAVNRALLQRAGLSLTENLVLCQVAMAPDGRLKMVDIADRLGIVKSAVTKTVDRLEARGWLSRQRDDRDRRTVYATLTPAGADTFQRTQPLFADAVTSHLSGPLSTAEIAELRHLLGKLNRGPALPEASRVNWPPMSRQAPPWNRSSASSGGWTGA